MNLKRCLRTAGKVLLIGIPSLLLLALLLAAWLVRRSWPQQNGTVAVRGLSDALAASAHPGYPQACG